MKPIIPEFLKKEFLKEKARPNQFPEDIKEFMTNYATQYKYSKLFTLRNIFMLLKIGTEKIPTCKLKGCRKKQIINKSNQLTEGCCVEHTRQIRNLIKYGVTNVSHRQVIKDKIKETCLKNNGSEFPMGSEKIRDKHKATCLKKYGVENASSLPETQEKVNKTNQERYGVNRPTQSAKFLLKGQSYKLKPYKWKTGEVSMLQGYEPIVLKELEEQGYKYDEIVSDIDKIPVIPYIFEGEQHNYYPDFFIPKENKIVEVKSDYTLKRNWDKNQAKFKATKELGFDFRLEVR